MINAEFSITVTVPLGPRRGQILLQADGANITGYLTLLDRKNYFQGRVLRKHHYIVSLLLQSPNELLDCDMVLLKKDNLLQGAIVSEKGCWPIEGIELSASAQRSDLANGELF